MEHESLVPILPKIVLKDMEYFYLKNEGARSCKELLHSKGTKHVNIPLFQEWNMKV